LRKGAAAAIMMCAVMVLVIGAPLVTADTHHIVKGAQGPRASAVSWNYMPTENGAWSGHIVNTGLRSLVVDVDDVTSGAPVSVLHQRIRFAAYPTDTIDTNSALMTKDRMYTITATPNGVRGSSCTVDDMFTGMLPPVAAFTYSVTGATVSVDGSGSSDPNVGGSITGWGWEWGDGMIGSGMMATHTYAQSGTYTILLTVMSNMGLTGSVSHDATVVVSQPPVASFIGVAASGGKLTVNGSASSSAVGIAKWDWNFGDNIIASGVTRTHTYVATGTYSVTLTVTDNNGQKASVSQSFAVVNSALPPLPYTVYGYTYASNGVTPLPGCAVSVTNVLTGETLIGNVADATGLYYVNDIMPLYFVSGNTMVISAVGPGGQTGSTSVVLDLTGAPYLQVDVTLV
jgi:PKD repeat protein